MMVISAGLQTFNYIFVGWQDPYTVRKKRFFNKSEIVNKIEIFFKTF
jgi:hypothetical protein